MKKELLIVALGLLTTATFAQNSVQETLTRNSKAERKAAFELTDHSSDKDLKNVDTFFNNTSAANKAAGGALDIRADYRNVLFDLFGGNATFDASFLTVFPDTAIVQEGTDGGGGAIFFRPANHGLVFVYDPQSELFGGASPNEQYFASVDVVNVDSILTAGIYFLNNSAATSDRLRYDIITDQWGNGTFVNLTAPSDVDSDGINDTISIQGIRLTGSPTNGGTPYTIDNGSAPTTLFRNFTPADTNGLLEFELGVSGIQIPANGGFGVLISYEPTAGSYTPNMDTVSLTDETGNANIFRALVFGNQITGDNNQYWSQFAVPSGAFFNRNQVGGFVDDDARYGNRNFTTTYISLAHTTSVHVSGTSSISVNELENNSGKFSVYPNPSNGTFNLKLDGFKGADTYTVTVMNILGQVVYEEEITIENGVKQISLPDVDKGMYIVNINSENLNVVEKVTIK